VLLWKRSNYFCCWRCVYWACYRCILHLQQYSHRLYLFFIFHWNGSFELFGSGWMHMAPLQWMLLGFRSVVKNTRFISSHNGVQKLISFLCVVREKLQHGTHPFVCCKLNLITQAFTWSGRAAGQPWQWEQGETWLYILGAVTIWWGNHVDSSQVAHNGPLCIDR